MAGAKGRAALAAACALLAACTMRSLIYPAPPFPVGPPPTGFDEAWIEAPGVGRVHAWHRSLAADASPAVVFFHGNAENLETMRLGGTVDGLAALDAHLLLADFPGYGRSDGSPSEETLAAAAVAAFDWLGERHPGASRLAVGWSLGAAAAARLAAERGGELSGLVLMSPWSSMEAVARRHYPGFLVRLLLPERWDSRAAVAGYEGRALVIHGARDTIIPVEQGRDLAAALPAARWVEIAEAGHNDLLGYRRVWDELTRFVAAAR